MAEGKFRISEEQKQQLIQAIVTLLTVLVSITLTLATQAVSDWIDRPEPVGEGESDAGMPGVQGQDDLETRGQGAWPFRLMPAASADGWAGSVPVATGVAG